MFPDFPRALNLFVVLVVFGGLRGNSLEGLVLGTVAGLAHDVLVGGPYGLYAFADTIVGYLVARLAQRLILDRTGMVFVVLAGAVVIEQAILVVLMSLLVADSIPPPLTWLGLQAILSAAVGTGFYAFAGSLRSRTERRRRDRGGRLRLGR